MRYHVRANYINRSIIERKTAATRCYWGKVTGLTYVVTKTSPLEILSGHLAFGVTRAWAKDHTWCPD